MRQRKRFDKEQFREKINKELRSNAAQVKFGLRFLLWLLIFISAIILITYRLRSIAFGIDVFTAKATGFVLNTLSLETERNGYYINAGGRSFAVMLECSGLYSACLYLSCVLAFPASFRKKSAGIAFGLSAIFVVNIIRLTMLVLISIYRPRISHFVHIYVWDASFLVLVVVLFLIWVDGVLKGTMEKLAFLAKFLAYSMALFVFVVFVIRSPYQSLLTRIVEIFFAKERYHDQNNVTLIADRIYNLVAFTSLMLATSRMSWSKRLKSICIGLIIIFIYHCVISLVANFRSFHDLKGFYRSCVENITLITNFALPLLLWIFFAYTYIFRKLKPVKSVHPKLSAH